jgi:hypothetical protein
MLKLRPPKRPHLVWVPHVVLLERPLLTDDHRQRGGLPPPRVHDLLPQPGHGVRLTHLDHTVQLANLRAGVTQTVRVDGSGLPGLKLGLKEERSMMLEQFVSLHALQC